MIEHFTVCRVSLSNKKKFKLSKQMHASFPYGFVLCVLIRITLLLLQAINICPIFSYNILKFVFYI